MRNPCSSSYYFSKLSDSQMLSLVYILISVSSPAIAIQCPFRWSNTYHDTLRSLSLPLFLSSLSSLSFTHRPSIPSVFITALVINKPNITFTLPRFFYHFFLHSQLPHDCWFVSRSITWLSVEFKGPKWKLDYYSDLIVFNFQTVYTAREHFKP